VFIKKNNVIKILTQYNCAREKKEFKIQFNLIKEIVSETIVS